MSSQPLSASRSPKGWWRSISTPLRGSSLQRESEEYNKGKRSSSWLRSGDDYSLSALLLFVLIPLGLGFLVLQSQLISHAQRNVEVQRPTERKLGNAIFPADLWKNLTDHALSETHNVGLGYVEKTIPEGVVNFLAQAERDLATDIDDLVPPPPELTASKTNSTRLSPIPGIGPTVSNAFPKRPIYTKDEEFELTWTYNMDEKLVDYVGNSEWMKKFPKGSRAYYNSLATFGHESNSPPHTRHHGLVGVFSNGTQYWKPVAMPPPIDKVNRTAAMEKGGFYLELANALPMDRESNDTRDEICKKQTWDYSKFSDASVVITFYNEPLSTLLRSVHSVLNLTPPSLLREIILVDDHSELEENLPGSELYTYIQLLPKTKLLRLPERRGLVWARLAGAQAAKAPVLVVLDSHVEMNYEWLEPQLERLADSPKSIVFPQIMALDADTFDYNGHAGIGCWLSWKWNMVERATLTSNLKNTSVIASPCMAGGLFAVNLDWFWEIGGYDEAMSMWGSENVEMGFRTWMCGGRMECTPCARTYHIYRSGGNGYTSPSENVWRNKLRTARLWMDEWYQIAVRFIGQSKTDLGDLNPVLELKERLKCKPFSWFLEHVDPTHDGRDFDEIEIFGTIRNKHLKNSCVDNLGHHKTNESWGLYGCHGESGSQFFYKEKQSKSIKCVGDERTCLILDKEGLPTYEECHKTDVVGRWTFNDEGQMIWNENDAAELCAAAADNATLITEKCDKTSQRQKWEPTPFKSNPSFKLPEFSEEYKRIHSNLPALSDK